MEESKRWKDYIFIALVSLTGIISVLIVLQSAGIINQ